ncbi:MAG: nicotinamide riboside transporter PnuC [Bacteroidota bacterium]
MNELLDGIIKGFRQTTLLEFVATVMGVASVTFSMMRRILVYPTGIISVGIYIYLTATNKLYADAGVNFYYLVMSIYGWYNWTKGKTEAAQIKVSVNNRKENLLSIAILVISYVVLSQTLSHFTDSDVPYWDAATTSFAILGMWLMAQKKLENWLAWIVTDLLSVPLYYHKGLVFTSLQFAIFTILATWGFFVWRGILNKNTTSPV